MTELPAGVLLRPVQLEAGGAGADGPDVDLALTVADAAEAAVLGVGETTREDVRTMLAGPHSPPDAQRLALVGDRAVGLLMVELDPERREVFVDAYAVPDGPAASGEATVPDGPVDLLDVLLAEGVSYAEGLAARDPVEAPSDVDPYSPEWPGWQVAAGAYEQDLRYADALRRNGFHPIRRHWRMHRDLTDVTPDDPPAPPGVTKVVAADDVRVQQLHEVYADSFRDHFGAAPLGLDAFVTLQRAMPGCDPARWWLALLDGRPAGLCILDDSRAEFGDSYVRTLGVARAARGQGIARWLLGCTFADAVRRGRTGVVLTVDSASPTGATRLYEGMGMRPRQVIDAWRRPA